MRRVHLRLPALVTLTAAIALGSPGAFESEPAPPAAEAAIRKLRDEAASLAGLGGLIKAPLARSFLDAVAVLPAIPTRTLLRDSGKTHYYTQEEAARLEASERAALESIELDGSYYYTTRYGTPLAYVRALELASGAGLGDLAGKRVLDFGYGAIGHLKLMAALGAETVGVEVDPLLRALYAHPGDQGAVRRAAGSGADGSVQLVHGQFPADPKVVQAVGESYDLFISKNTLKNGYIHPTEKVDPKRLVHLGVDDADFVKHVVRVLKPGGLAVIYNLHPPPNPPDKPYIPWADGRCPFARGLWEAAGMRIVAFDVDDAAAARAMARALGWDKGAQAMDPEKDLFATYTIVAKPPR